MRHDNGVRHMFFNLYGDVVRFLLLSSPICSARSQVGGKSLTAKEGSLSKTMKGSFADLCLKYDDVRNVDRLAAVQVSTVRHF